MQNSVECWAECTCRGDVGCDCVTRLHSLVVTVDTVYCVHCILLFIITRLQVLSSLHYIITVRCSLSSLHWTVLTLLYSVYYLQVWWKVFALSHHYSGQNQIITVDSVDTRHSFTIDWLQCVLFAGRVESDCSLSPLQDVWDCISLQSSGTQWSGIKKAQVIIITVQLNITFTSR